VTGPRLRQQADRRRDALAQADELLTAAKRAFSNAALACLRGQPDAAHKARAALHAVDTARARLRELSDESEAKS